MFPRIDLSLPGERRSELTMQLRVRADGRSVYQRHGGTRYATRAQLVMEERMAAQASTRGAPRLARTEAAHALGADPARLEDALTGRARTRDAQDARTIDVGKTPHGLAVTPDGRTLLAAVYGEDRIAFVDTASQAIVATVPVAKPHTIAVRPDGKVAYVSSQEPGKFALVVVDIATRAALRSIALEKPPRRSTL